MLTQPTIPMKVCSKCKHPKTWGHFYFHNGVPNGWCKECYSIQYSKRQTKNKLLLSLVDAVTELYTVDEFLDLPSELFPKLNEVVKTLQKKGLI